MSDYSGFKVKRTHAPGAAASVHEASSDQRPGRFALKIFHPAPSTDVRRVYAIEGWLLAAERQQRVSSKDGGVVPEVLALGRCTEGAFVVTPWQEHPLEPLVETLTAKGDLLRALAEHLLTTLEQWEKQVGGPHGRLKPANVFLRGDGPLGSRTAQLSDPWYYPGANPAALRSRDLAGIGGMLAQVVRKRAATGWPLEEGPEWLALGRPGKAWLAYCNFLMDPRPETGMHTLAEARRRLKKIPVDARPVRTAILSTAAVGVLAALGVMAFARFGDPEIMPRSIGRLAVTLDNPRIPKTITPDWALLCRAWDTWLPDLQNNAERLEKTSGLWNGPNDPLRLAIRNFLTTAATLQPGTLVPQAAKEKRLGVLADSPPPAVRSELVVPAVRNDVENAMGKVSTLQGQLENWPRWKELHSLLAVLEENKFSRTAETLRPLLPPVIVPVATVAPGVPAGPAGTIPDPVHTLKLLNELSLDDTGTLLLASRWSEFFKVKTDMENSHDRVQAAMPRLMLARLTDRPSIGDFADALAEPLAELHRRYSQFEDPQVVRERFLKESPLQAETAEVREEDFPRWEQELAAFSKVPVNDDPRRAAELDASANRLTNAAADLEQDAPEAEPGGPSTLARADFDQEFAAVDGTLKTLRFREIVRRDLPEVAQSTNQISDSFRKLEQRLDATLALLRPEVWLKKAALAFGKFDATKQRWSAWQQSALTGVTSASLEGAANRERFRGLRQQERTVRNWIDGLEGLEGFASLTVPDLAGISSDTAPAVRQLEKERREQAVKEVANAAVWRGTVPTLPWASEPDAVRAPLEAHRKWLTEMLSLGGELDRLNQFLADGLSWNEGVSDMEDQLAQHPGIDAISGPPAAWRAEAKELGQLVQSTDRPTLEAAANSGGLSRKLTAWRRFGALPGWPTGPDDLDFDGRVVKALRANVGSDVKDELRRRVLLGELAKETRVRWNRAARNSARKESEMEKVFERMDTYGIGESDLEESVAYNLALWNLKKKSDWSETDLGKLKTRRDGFLAAARAKSTATAIRTVADFLGKLSEIDLTDNPNRKPTPSPRLKGWKEELSDGGLGLIATWTSGNKNVRLEFSLVQPEDDSTPPFYLAKREIAAGEFVDLVGARAEGATVLKELQPWAHSGDSYDKPYDRALTWKPRADFNGIELNQTNRWIYLPTSPVLGLLDNTEAANNSPVAEREALAETAKEKPSPRSPLQQVPPEAARIFAENLIGARLPTPKEWVAVVKLLGAKPAGNFRGPVFQGLYSFLDKYVVSNTRVPWRPVDSAFKIMVDPPGGGRRRPYQDDGQASSDKDEGLLWPTSVDEGPTTGNFVNLFGNVWIYLYDEATRQFYVAGGSALSPPAIDIKVPQRVEVSGMIGAKKVTEGFDDVGVRPAFDAPPGFRERYKLLLLVREQTYLTL